jgi:DNA-directed RNA polymerase II subunit RPB1
MNKNTPSGPTYYSKTYDLCFYVLGNEENLLESNVNITNKEVMKGDRPMLEGIYDAHMGTTDHAWNCATCGNRKTICPGHFGSIDLKYPLKSPMFRDELLKWLKITCYYCGEIIVPIKKKIKAARLLSELVKNVRSIKMCPACMKPHMQVVKDKKKPAIFYRVQEENKAIIKMEEFLNHQIEHVLQRIKDHTVIKMGKPLRSHPIKFILRTIRAPPNTIRPDIRRIGGARSSNSDTTSLLKTIIEINDALPDDIPPIDQIGQDLKDMYFNLDMTYFAMLKGGGGGDVKLVTNTNKPPIAIAEHFPKKTGRIRRNLMGKRVEYMIRSVITGDSRLKIHEVGIPMIHAQNLEIPETVTNDNLARLTTYYMNRNDRYPGCKRIVKKSDGHAYRIEHMNKDYQLQEGDVVMRDMITGDVVNFNRQPSLLFSNIAAMRVVVMDVGFTLRINPSVCNYYNADFDGDQMNSIVPQGIQARNECMKISKVARWFISPQNQAPLVGAFQDCLIGLAELTKEGINFNKWHAMNLFNDIYSKGINYDFKGKSFSNRDLVSRLLPKINLINKSPSIYREEYATLLKYNPTDTKVNIIRGQLKSGILDKSTAGQGVMGSIFHIIANEYGNDRALETVYNLQQLTHRFFLYHGFTVGVNDINISNTAMKEVKRRIASMILESRKITQRLNNGKLIAPLGMKLNEFYESEQLNSLATGDDFVNPIFADIDLRNNGIARLILTGSKGKPPNFIAINGAIGVQTINGRRFGPQAGWGRSSPYFVRYDTDPAASGYISTSFREGITNDVYPFMAGEARHGMISNALSTSIAGYQSRISIKNLETILTDNLRKSVKGFNVVQPLYAECGLDPAKTEKVKFPTVMISNDDFANNYKADIKLLNKKYQNSTVSKMLDDEFEQMTVDRIRYRKIHLTLEKHNPKEYIMDNTKQLPVNIQRIIDDVVYNYNDVIETIDDKNRILDPIYAINSVNELCNNLAYAFQNDTQRKLKNKIPAHLVAATNLMQILLRSYLCIRYLLKKGVINHLLDIIIKRVNITFKKSLVEYGTSVGIIAAQCLSEPMTQFVLNSKHRSGGQGGTTTNEIVRIQEVLGAKDTDVMKNPHMLIMVKPEYENDKIKVQEIANHLEMMNFDRFITTTRIFFEEYGNPTHPEFIHESKIIIQIEKHNYGQKKPNDLAKWCIRYGLDKEELILKNMKLETIILAIRKNHPELYVIYSPENAKDVFIRCYLRNDQFKQSQNYYEDNVYPLMSIIKNVIIRGISGLISTSVMDVIKNIEQKNGSLERKKVFGVFAIGTNLSEVLSNKYIDKYATQSDSITEMEQCFGIVAARNKIINELTATLQTPSRVHTSIFADEQSYSGKITSIQKTGLAKREQANLTLRLSFQTPVQILQEAASNGMCDRISGVSGPLVLGTLPNVGTTYNSISVNEEFINANIKSLDDVLEDL